MEADDLDMKAETIDEMQEIINKIAGDVPLLDKVITVSRQVNGTEFYIFPVKMPGSLEIQHEIMRKIEKLSIGGEPDRFFSDGDDTEDYFDIEDP